MVWPFSRRDGKYAARWLNDALLQPESSHSLEDVLFMAFVANILSYGVREEDIGCKPSPVGGMETKVHEHNMDSALFELACFRFVNFDVYLYNRHEHLRGRQSIVLQRKIVGLFSGALGRSVVEKNFSRRIDAYGALYRTRQERPSDTEHLAAVLMLARGNRIVKAYDFTKSPMENVGFDTEYLYSTARVHGWYMGMTPAFYEMLEEICPQLER